MLRKAGRKRFNPGMEVGQVNVEGESQIYLTRSTSLARTEIVTGEKRLCQILSPKNRAEKPLSKEGNGGNDTRAQGSTPQSLQGRNHRHEGTTYNV